MPTILRVKKPERYTTLDNRLLRDKRLSWAARGLLAFLLSKPDNWKVRVDNLINESPAGRDANYSILDELASLRYLVRIRRKGPGGHFIHETIVSESPLNDDEVKNLLRLHPIPDDPEMELPFEAEPDQAKPQPGSPDTGSPDNKKDLSKELPKKEKRRKRTTEPETKQQFDAVIRRVFQFWQDTFKHVLPTGQYTLTKGKRDMLRDRLLGPLKPTEQSCCNAFIAILHTPFNMGQNPEHKFYCHWHNAFKDDETLEKRLLDYRLIEGQLRDAEIEKQAKNCEFCEGSGHVYCPPKGPEGLTPVPEDVWRQTLSGFSQVVEASAFETWFSNVRCTGVNCDSVYLQVPNTIVKEWIETNHGEAVTSVIGANFGKAFKIQWLIGSMVPCSHGVALQ